MRIVSCALYGLSITGFVSAAIAHLAVLLFAAVLEASVIVIMHLSLMVVGTASMILFTQVVGRPFELSFSKDFWKGLDGWPVPNIT
jgi:hypothetical protein